MQSRHDTKGTSVQIAKNAQTKLIKTAEICVRFILLKDIIKPLKHPLIIGISISHFCNRICMLIIRLFNSEVQQITNKIWPYKMPPTAFRIEEIFLTSNLINFLPFVHLYLILYQIWSFWENIVVLIHLYVRLNPAPKNYMAPA